MRNLQSRTGGFTEFVPLPFVAQMAPIYRRAQYRWKQYRREIGTSLDSLKPFAESFGYAES